MAKKQGPQGPLCPGCDYPIFGVRDMRCPECGRTLDVRDFNPENASHRGESQRYERNAAAGGVIGIVVVGGMLIGVIALVRYFMRYRVIPGFLLMVIGFLALLLVGVVLQTGQSMGAWFKGRRGS